MDLPCFENKVTLDLTWFENKWRFDDAFSGIRKLNRLELKPTPDAEDREDSILHKKRKSIEVDLTRFENKRLIYIKNAYLETRSRFSE